MRLLFGVLLSGMGVYAATQLGVLRALEEHGMVPSALVGIGCGAWIAGLYACNPDSREVYAAIRDACRKGRRLIDLDRRAMLSASGSYQGLIRGERLTALLEEQTQRRTLAELDRTLAIPTLALPTRKTLVLASSMPPDTGEAVWTQQATVALAIRAAVAAPSLIRPAIWMGVPLVGASGLHTASATLKQLNVKHALCVDAGAQRAKGRLNVWDIAALSLGGQEEMQSGPAKWQWLTPRVPDTVHVDQLEALDLCVEIGYVAAQEAIPRINARLGAQPGKMLAFPKHKESLFERGQQ